MTDRFQKAAFVYGLRDRRSKTYFYVGSTRVSVEKRLKSHLQSANSSKAVNRHLAHKIRQIGLGNVVCDVLEETTVINQFQSEYQWIANLRAKSHPLTNIKLVPDYELTREGASYIEGCAAKVCDREWIIAAVQELQSGPGLAVNPVQQSLLEQFHRVAVLYLKSLIGRHWDEYCQNLGFTQECEQSRAIFSLIEALP